MREAVRSQAGLSVRAGVTREISRALPEEAAVAMVYDGGALAVMMATPADLRDLAIGFSLGERIIERPEEIERLEVAAQENGVEARMWLRADRSETLRRRRRFMAGPVGCGLCGVDSLEAALRPLPRLAAAGPRLSGAEVEAAVAALAGRQPLHDRTRAVHAAGFFRPGDGIVAAREDVGRHNALDKLVGALALAGTDAAAGAIVITSRVSIEMVQKAVLAGATILIAVSAPTAHAVRLAEAAGLTLVASARGGGFEIFAHPQRIGDGESCNVA